MEPTRIAVWDLPVRLFHWLLALCFAGAWATAEAKGWRGVHLAFGYTFAGLIAFRLVWGIVGSRYARFASFAFGPTAVATYLRSLVTRNPEHHVGHNPAGAWAIFAMIALAIAVAATGWLALGDPAAKWWEEIHEGVAAAMLGLVVIHVAGVVISSLRHRENLVAAMVTGKKVLKTDTVPGAAPGAVPNAASGTAQAPGFGNWGPAFGTARGLVGTAGIAGIVLAVWGGLVALPGLAGSPWTNVAAASLGNNDGSGERGRERPDGHRDRRADAPPGEGSGKPADENESKRSHHKHRHG